MVDATGGGALVVERRHPGIGLGFDVHRFGAPGPLRLGGIVIDHPVGLLGHSDADALCHAVADAVLGAAGLGDLGEHFPSSDERWRGASSLRILELVAALLPPLGLVVAGADATVVAEQPRLAPHRSAMILAIRTALSLPEGALSIKVKSSDGFGIIGGTEGVAALAVATVVRETAS